ncbi:MAG: arginine--tRNA ligase [Phycisphaeraceae bacterium]|nr:MAG: arginine--tRNA ligase [Phycisphaeraceae bacterium]
MSHDPLQILSERFLDAMRGAFGDRLPEGADPMIAASRNPQFGDYQSNAAMPLAKALGMKPRDIAAQIVEKLDLSGVAEPVDEHTIAGPGFINIRLDRGALAGLLDALDSPDLGIEPPESPSTIVVDLCGVNLAKQMHVGHLRSTVIGDTIARVFERLGHRVIRQNHLGDWGLPIAMVTRAVMDRAAKGEIDLDAIDLDELDALYKSAQKSCDPESAGEAAAENLARAKTTLVALQSGDAETVAAWKRISDITVNECVAVCARLHATVLPEHTAGESTYRDELAGIVDDLLSRGVAEESRGAVIVDLKDAGIAEPLLVRKSDGGFLYATTDMAAIRRRVQKFGGDRIIYAVDARQSLHFRQLFAAAKKAGYAKRPDGTDAQLDHAAFGTVLGEDNRPFKTRTGENVKLADLLDQAVERAGAAVKEKNPDLSPEDQRIVAEAVGIGAIKYTDLANDRVRDYVFSFDRMLAFEGNTGPYLQYALVRIRSILRKAKAEHGVDEAALGGDGAMLRIEAPEEKDLALLILRFPGVVRTVADSLEPHRLCGYLYEVSTAFSGFFQNCPVLRAQDDVMRLSRLRLCRLTGRVLESGLETLGIVALDRM